MSSSKEEGRETTREPAGISEASPLYETQLHEYDVLLGRGAPILSNPGNVRMRALVQVDKAQYMSTGRHALKDEIARRILDYITVRGGRFLRRIQTSAERRQLQVPDGTESAYVLVDEMTSLQKIKQALREQDTKSEEEQRSLSSSTRKRKASPGPSESQGVPGHMRSSPEGAIRQDMMSRLQRQAHVPSSYYDMQQSPSTSRQRVMGNLTAATQQQSQIGSVLEQRLGVLEQRLANADAAALSQLPAPTGSLLGPNLTPPMVGSSLPPPSLNPSDLLFQRQQALAMAQAARVQRVQAEQLALEAAALQQQVDQQLQNPSPTLHGMLTTNPNPLLAQCQSPQHHRLLLTQLYGPASSMAAGIAGNMPLAPFADPSAVAAAAATQSNLTASDFRTMSRVDQSMTGVSGIDTTSMLAQQNLRDRQAPMLLQQQDPVWLGEGSATAAERPGKAKTASSSSSSSPSGSKAADKKPKANPTL